MKKSHKIPHVFAFVFHSSPGVTGKYYRFMKQTESSEESNDLEVAKKFWDVSAELVGYNTSEDNKG